MFLAFLHFLMTRKGPKINYFLFLLTSLDWSYVEKYIEHIWVKFQLIKFIGNPIKKHTIKKILGDITISLLKTCTQNDPEIKNLGKSQKPLVYDCHHFDYHLLHLSHPEVLLMTTRCRLLSQFLSLPS